MLKLLPLISGMLLAAGCFAAVPEVKNPASIMQLHKVVQKIDKAACRKTVRTVHIQCTGTVTGMNIRMDQEVFYEAETGKFVSRMKMPGMPDTVELYDGKNAFTIMPGLQTKTAAGKQLAQKRFAARCTDPALKLFEQYDNLMLDQKIYRIGKRPCFRLVGTPKNEPELPPHELLYDAKTGLLCRENSIVSTDMGDIPSSMTVLQYQRISGMPVPRLMQIKQLNMTVMLRVEKMEFDSPVPEKTFDCEAIENEAK